MKDPHCDAASRPTLADDSGHADALCSRLDMSAGLHLKPIVQGWCLLTELGLPDQNPVILIYLRVSEQSWSALRLPCTACLSSILRAVLGQVLPLLQE